MTQQLFWVRFWREQSDYMAYEKNLTSEGIWKYFENKEDAEEFLNLIKNKNVPAYYCSIGTGGGTNEPHDEEWGFLVEDFCNDKIKPSF